ncbi:hypothetical protein PR003_g29287, partial [Phytophthora rubi]
MQGDYAILESNTPVECTQIHHYAFETEKKALHKSSPTLPMSKRLGSAIRSSPLHVTRPRNSSLVAILGGSAGCQTKTALENSGLATSRVGGMNGSHSSFLPSGSVLNMSFHPSMTSTSNISRPSRLMSASELYELKDQLWKASTSGGLRKVLSTVSSGDCANPRAQGQLSFFNQMFNTSTPPESPMTCIPLPRESVALIVDAVRVSALEDDEKCRFLFEMFDVEHRGVLSKEGVRAFIEATFAANGVEFLGAFDYDAVVDKVFDRCRQHDTMTYSEFKSAFGAVVAEADDDKSKEALGRLSVMAQTQRQKEVMHKHDRSERWHRVKKFCRRYNAEIFWLTLYSLLMVAV